MSPGRRRRVAPGAKNPPRAAPGRPAGPRRRPAMIQVSRKSAEAKKNKNSVAQKGDLLKTLGFFTSRGPEMGR